MTSMLHNTRKPIETVAIIGLGALGILYGTYLSKHMPKESIRIIADADRIRRYQESRIYSNGVACDFHYVTPDEKMEPADLVIFAVKYNGLAEAIEAMSNQIGDNTIILSALNGISSEGMIGEAYGMNKLLYCVAQGMDAVKVDNQLTYENMGMLVFGEQKTEYITEKMQVVADFFDRVSMPYQLDMDMNKRLWGKFMLNVGVNQVVAVCEGNYGDILVEGPHRDTMIAAMREVLILSEYEGVYLTEEDLNYWLVVLSKLSHKGKPSMRQDLEAKRRSEVELFAGTVRKMAKKHGILVPVNDYLYERIMEMEALF